MRLILTRHGETIENQENIIQGQTHGTLSPEGISQAEKLALRLKDEKIDYIYSSDLNRALNTAKTIAEFHKNIPLILAKELREWNLGELQGMKRDGRDLEPKQGETKEELFKRGHDFINKIIKKHIDDSVLLVGHNGINKAIIASIIGKTLEQSKDIERQKNTAVTIFEINKDKKHHIHVFNCTKHLE